MTSDTAVQQLSRILHLIPGLADGETHDLGEVAREARVDRAVVLRDILSISERFEAPGGFVEGLQIFLESDERVSVVPNHFLRPMRLTRGELCALELGLGMLRAERPPEEHRAIDGAVERLRAAIGRLPGPEVGELRVASLAAGGSLERLRELREAHRARRKVRLTYRKGADEAASTRVICPYAIVYTNGMWYAVAHCESSDGVRFFRLDRVEAVEQLDARYERPREFTVETVMRDGKAFHSEEARTLRLRYSPRIARWIAEREAKELAADGSLVVEHPLADVDWALRHVLQYGPDVTVLDPGEVREAVRRRLEEIANA
jgi:proteasome accessory factor C